MDLKNKTFLLPHTISWTRVLVMACALVCNVAQAAAEDRVNGVTVDGGDAANDRVEATTAPWDSDGRTLVTGSTGLVDDWADYYEVAIVRTGTLGLDLYGLSEDLDLLLFNSAGELLERPGTSGPGSESIVYTVTAGERYVVGVVPDEGVSSDYSLGMVSPSVDDDGDGVPNLDDLCPDTPPGTTVDEFGCPLIPDSDGDGVNDALDECPDTPPGTTVAANGCPDSDGDGVDDAIDRCPDTPAGASVNLDGCSNEQLDSDDDGVNDDLDLCPNTPPGTTVDEIGCPLPIDSDGDGVSDALDLCPGTPAETAVDAEGCPLPDFTVEALRADPRFSHLDGAGYTIVVLDSGIDLDNPAFGADANGDGVADRIVFNRDFSNDGFRPDGDGTAEDVFGRGTRVASVLGSSSPTAPGVAPGVNIVALQVLDDNGNGTGGSLERALQWVIDNESAFNILAVNLPVGQGINSSVPFSGILSDELAVLADLGVISIAAAGNDYYSHQTEGLDYPAAERSAIAVGATFAGDMGPVDWSNSNGARAFTSGIDRILPLSQRSSLLGTVFAPVVPTPFDTEMGGTGLASAYVTGIVALSQQLAEEVLGQRLTPAQFRSLLFDSADSIFDGDDENDNVDNTGKSFPRINAVALAEAISAFDPDGGTTPNQDDIPGDLSTQAKLPMGSSVEGKLQYEGDTDWYRLELSAGIGYRLWMAGITLEDPYLSLFDSAGELVASKNDSDGTLDAAITFIPLTTGTFFLSAEASSFDQTGTYIVEVAPAQPDLSDSIPADANTPVTLSVPTTFSSQVDFGGDEDWLRVLLNEGDTYQIALNGQANSDDPLGDPVLELYDATGTLLAVNDDGGPGLNALLNYTAPGSGAYFVNARALAGVETGVYQLGITGSPPQGDNIPNNFTTTAQLSVDQPFSSQIDFPGDGDLILINLEANVLYSLWATGTVTDAGLDPQIQLFSRTGVLIATDDDSGPGLSALRDFYVTESGTYYVMIQDSGFGAGAYTLVVEREEEEMDVRTILSQYTAGDATDPIADSCTSGGRASAALQEACNNLFEAAAGGDPGVDEALREITPDKATTWNIAVRQNNQVQNQNIGNRMVALRAGARGTSFAGLTSAPSIQNTRSVKQADPIQKGEEIFNVNIVFDSMLGDIAFDQSTVTYDETGAMTGGQLIIEFLKRPLSKFGAYYVLDVETGYGRICLNYETDGCNPGVNTMLETTGSRTAGLIKSDQRVNTFVVDPQISGAREVGTSASLKAWANSGLPVIFGSATPGTCTVSDSVVTFHAPGTCTVTADQAGNNHFNAAPQAAIDIAVAREDQAITGFIADPASGVVDGTSTLSATASSGLPVDFGSNTPGICTVLGSTVSYVAAGNCIVTASQAGDANYNTAPQVTLDIMVAKADQAITGLAADPASGVVDGSSTLNATASSGLPVTFASSTPGICTVSGLTVSYVAVGNCIVTASQAGDDNYNAAPQETLDITVAKADQEITGFTADPASGVVDGSSTLSATGGGSDNPVVFASNTPGICTVSGDTVSYVAAGTCTVTADQAGDDNYNAAPQETLDIKVLYPPDITSVSPNGQTADYSDAIATVTITAVDKDTPASEGNLALSWDGSPSAPLNIGQPVLLACESAFDGAGQSCTWTVDGILDEAAGGFLLSFTASDGVYDSSTCSDTEGCDHALAVEAEDAAVKLETYAIDNDVDAPWWCSWNVHVLLLCLRGNTGQRHSRLQFGDCMAG
jgi:hypothetical protein